MRGLSRFPDLPLISREQFARNFLVVTRKSITCNEDVVCVGRVTNMLRGCYDNVTMKLRGNCFREI